MIKQIGVVYVKNDIKLSCPMRSGVIFNKDKTSDMTNHTSTIYVENDIELLWLIKLGVDCEKN